MEANHLRHPRFHFRFPIEHRAKGLNSPRPPLASARAPDQRHFIFRPGTTDAHPQRRPGVRHRAGDHHVCGPRVHFAGRAADSEGSQSDEGANGLGVHDVQPGLRAV